MWELGHKVDGRAVPMLAVRALQPSRRTSKALDTVMKTVMWVVGSF